MIKSQFQPAVAGLICGIFSFFIPEVTGLGTSTIQNIFGDVYKRQTKYIVGEFAFKFCSLPINL